MHAEADGQILQMGGRRVADVLCQTQQVDTGVAGGGAARDNHLIPGDIPARSRDGQACRCRGRGWGRGSQSWGPKDAMPDVPQIPHIGRSRCARVNGAGYFVITISQFSYVGSCTMIKSCRRIGNCRRAVGRRGGSKDDSCKKSKSSKFPSADAKHLYRVHIQVSSSLFAITLALWTQNSARPHHM